MAAGIVIARRLGPEIRGYYGLISVAVNLLIALGQFGLGHAIAYQTGKSKYSNSKVLSFTIASSIILGTTLAILFYFVYPHIPSKWNDISRQIMIIGLAATPFAFLHNFLNRFLLGMLKIKQSNISNLLRFLSYLLLVIALIWIMRGSLREATICLTLSFVIASILTYILFTRSIRPDMKLDSSLVKFSFRYGFKVHILNTFNFLNFQMAIFIIQHFLTVSHLSYYQIAFNISQRLWLIPGALSTVLFHTLVATDRKSYTLTPRVCRNNIFLMVILAAPVVLFGKYIILLLYGEEYSPTTLALYSVMWGVIVYPIFKILYEDFAAQNRLGLAILASVVGFIINLSANLLMVPRYGIVGAGLATSLSFTTMAVILIAFYMHYQEVTVRELLFVNREDFSDYFKSIKNVMVKIRETVMK